MTDFAKRRTLKGLAAAAAGTATAGLATHALAGSEVDGFDDTSTLRERHLALQTRISAHGNDIEAQFVNAGTETLRITHLSPREVNTFRGRLNVVELTNKKPLTLKPGQSISLAMTPHDNNVQINELMQQGQSLSAALKKSAKAFGSDGLPIHISVNETLPFA